jgi:hypothetical protein
MHWKPTSRIVLVDDSHRGATARIIESAVGIHNSAMPPSEQMNFEAITIQHARHQVATYNPLDTAIFISVADKTLSHRSHNPTASRVACESLEVAQSFVHLDPRFRVVLVRQAGVAVFTGVDTTAALLAGMAVVIDDRLLLADGVFSSILTYRHLDRKDRAMLMAGEPKERFLKLKAMLDEWMLTDEGGDVIDLKCFRVSMALSQLDCLHPLPGSGHKYSFEKLARSLNLAAPTTSFRLSEVDLRKALGLLTDRFLPTEHAHAERVRLPAYAREREFPFNPPAIKGIQEKDMPKRLYSACIDARTEKYGAVTEELWIARLPLSEFRHLPRINPAYKET